MVMKKRNLFSMTAMTLFVSVALMPVLTGCTSTWQSAASADDGMYGSHNRVEIANRQRAEAEARRAEAEARRAELEALRVEAEVAALQNGTYSSSNNYSNSYTSVLADTYESAYARRLMGFTSPTYRMPSSYYNLRYSSTYNYVTAYDPAFYNIMVSGDQVWVEPKYISSMFGTWGATNVTIGIGIATPYSWYYGWNRPYYSSAWWGYPRYSWYDWNWGICYNPGHWWGYGYGWGPSWGAGWHYGPNYGWRPSAPAPPRPQVQPRPGRQNITGGYSSPSTRYQSPSSGKNYGTGGSNRGTVNGSGTFNPNRQGNSNSGTGSGSGAIRSRGNTGSGSSGSGSGSSTNRNNTQRGGSSSFFNNNSGGSRSNGGSSYNGGSSGGSRSGGGSSSGGGNRGNSIGR